jgi:hypothetical protein
VSRVPHPGSPQTSAALSTPSRTPLNAGLRLGSNCKPPPVTVATNCPVVGPPLISEKSMPRLRANRHRAPPPELRVERAGFRERAPVKIAGGHRPQYYGGDHQLDGSDGHARMPNRRSDERKHRKRRIGLGRIAKSQRRPGFKVSGAASSVMQGAAMKMTAKSVFLSAGITLSHPSFGQGRAESSKSSSCCVLEIGSESANNPTSGGNRH